MMMKITNIPSKKFSKRFTALCFSAACLFGSGGVHAEEGGKAPTVKESGAVKELSIATKQEGSAELTKEQPVALSVAELKKKVIKLNRDLFILEEDLLFPANTQYVVYLSLGTGEFFKPDSITLKVDDEIVAAHLYTERQISALSRGGMQRLHMGNLKSGEHEMTVIIEGQGTDNRAVKQAASLPFEKGTDVASFEISIRDQSENYQAKIQIVEWD
jgi:hypothetical protein